MYGPSDLQPNLDRLKFDRAYKIASLLSYTNSKIKVLEEWIMTNCPFARKTHAKGTDNNPSFGINWREGTFNCFTCGKSGRLETLPYELKYLFPQDDWEWLFGLIIENNPKDRRLLKIVSNRWRDKKLPADFPITVISPHIFKFLKPLEKEYKSITPQIAADYMVLENDYDIKLYRKLIMFPIISKDNEIIAIKVRRIRYNGKESHRTLDSIANIELPKNRWKTAGFWYGEYDLDKEADRIYLVEGERDRILLSDFLIKEGFHTTRRVLASLGKFTPRQMYRLYRHFINYEVVLLFDNDKAGQYQTAKFKDVYKKIKKAFKVLEPKSWFGVKDPAEAYEKGILGDLVSQKNLKEVRL